MRLLRSDSRSWTDEHRHVLDHDSCRVLPISAYPAGPTSHYRRFSSPFSPLNTSARTTGRSLKPCDPQAFCSICLVFGAINKLPLHRLQPTFRSFMASFVPSKIAHVICTSLRPDRRVRVYVRNRGPAQGNNSQYGAVREHEIRPRCRSLGSLPTMIASVMYDTGNTKPRQDAGHQVTGLAVAI
nr:hypothetical protein CFP56_70563 [Quercus suber]